METLKEYTKILVETEEENPVTIAEITSEEINAADGYRVRLTPDYEPFVPKDSSGTKYPVGGTAIPRPLDIHEHNQ